MDKQGYIDIVSHGLSMLPFIRTGNVCRFVPVEPAQLRKGDIVLFHTDAGTLVGHRLIDISLAGRQWIILCKGDSNPYPDEPVTSDRIIGRMVSIRKSARTMDTSSYWIRLWGKYVVRLPWLSLSIHTCLKVIKKLRGMRNRLWAS
ncbi:signal peptidase I [Paenibacillus hamazuiensis]|uniref:signal peptidase I n=1 Tax=Paenibacillus hamazuiensis TaxID=2936508 RepID=UPI00200C1B00|nr:signal peptidase I [Paenibacillus hamazuiensis]